MTAAALADRRPDVGAPRLCVVDGDALATLGRLQASHGLANGQANVVALGAIAERLGRRWSARRELVHEHAERALRRSLGEDGFCQRISETDYVVVQPSASRLAAQALCLNAMRETLTHFLGEARMIDLVVHEITRITPEGVFGERIDVAAADAGAEPIGADVDADDEGLGSIDQWTPFVASDGRRVRVSCQLEPVIQLKASERIGYRIARRVLAMPSDVPLSAVERRNLARADIERVDFATLARGLDRLKSAAGAVRQPTLIVPVSFTTLSSARARNLIVDFFTAAQATVQHGVIGEVCDIDGVPPSALLAATAVIRPYCLFVVGQLAEAPTTSVRALREAALQGVSIECPSTAAGEAEFIGWSRSLIRAARPAIKSVIAYRLQSMRQAAIAGLLGVTHGSLRAAA